MTAQIFLTSAAFFVAQDIGVKLKAKKRGLTLLFIGTAAEVEEGDREWENDDLRSLEKAGFAVTQYSITGRDIPAIETVFQNHDVLYVGGGNT